MTNKEIFKIWAPYGKRWTDWVRPVAFISMKQPLKPFIPSQICLPVLDNFANNKNTAIIIDLNGEKSVEAGILLAKKQYRPVPIYNGTAEQHNARATTDNHSIQAALLWGAKILQNTNIPDDAPPAFLTDTNRLQREKIDRSVFDNSWDVYHQDLPTENYFLENGISQILVISRAVPKDLRKIFAKHPQKKLSILWSDGYSEPTYTRKGG